MRSYKRGVRVLAVAASLCSAAVLAGCGDDVQVEFVWGGPPQPDPGGAVSVAGFTAFQRNVDQPWERSPAMAAGEFLRLDERRASTISIVAKAPGEGGGPQTVVVTLDGLLDDSIRAERWTLGFEPAEDETYRLTAALREQRCQRGRGHQDFSAEDCR